MLFIEWYKTGKFENVVFSIDLCYNTIMYKQNKGVKNILVSLRHMYSQV